MNKRPQLGQWLTVCAILKKSRVHSQSYLGTKILPITVTWSRQPLKTPKAMMYVGWRSVYEGLIRSRGYEEGAYFELQRTLVVWVFIPNNHSNMLYVLPEDVSGFEAQS